MPATTMTSRLIWLAIPLVILLGLVSWLFINRTQHNLVSSPEVEALVIEQVTLEPGQFQLLVRNAGPEALTIAQVTINDAAWISLVSPKTTVEPLSQANILLEDYEWVSGQNYQIRIYTTKANSFVVNIPNAQLTPRLTQPHLLRLLLNGLLVGLVPVYIGLFCWSFLRDLYLPGWLGWLGFVVAILIGRSVEVWLLLPQVVGKNPGLFQGWSIILIGLIAVFSEFYRTYATPQGPDQAARIRDLRGYRLAISIGLFSLAEGIIFGQVVSGGIAPTWLWLRVPLWIVSLLLLNLSKGMALALAFSDSRPLLLQWFLVGFIAGFPAMLGFVLGAFPVALLFVTLLLGVSSGAMLWLIIEMILLARDESEGERHWPQLTFGVTGGLLLTTAVNFAVVIFG